MTPPTSAHKMPANGNKCPLCTPRFSLPGLFRLIIFYLEDAWRPLSAIFLLSFITIIPIAGALFWLLGPPPFDLVMPLSYLSLGLEVPTNWQGELNIMIWLVFSWLGSAFIMRQIFWWSRSKEMPMLSDVFQVSWKDWRWILYFAVLFCLCSVRHMIKETCPGGVCARPTQVITLPDQSPGAKVPPAYLSTQSVSSEGHIYQQEVNIGQCKLRVNGAGYMLRDLIPHMVWGRLFHYILEAVLTVVGLSVATRLSLAIHFLSKNHTSPWKHAFTCTRRAGISLFLGALFIALGYILMREIITVGLFYLAPFPTIIIGILYGMNALLWTLIYSLYLAFAKTQLTHTD